MLFDSICTSFLYIRNMPFSKEYLKDYEDRIRTLPLEDLYDIIGLIRDHPFKADDTPERVRIVEKRIIELENEPAKLDPAEELNEKLEEKYKKKYSTEGYLLNAAGVILTIVSLGLLIIKKENGYGHLDLPLCLLGVSLFCSGFSSLIDKRTSGRGWYAHKDAYPRTYWSSVLFQFACGIVAIVFGIYFYLSNK